MSGRTLAVAYLEDYTVTESLHPEWFVLVTVDRGGTPEVENTFSVSPSGMTLSRDHFWDLVDQYSDKAGVDPIVRIGGES
jgi:hypothetical protein